VPQRPEILPDRAGRRYGPRVSDEPAHRSSLTLRQGPSTGPSHPRPGDVTDAVDPRLAELRDAVAVPVVSSVLTAQELEGRTGSPRAASAGASSGPPGTSCPAP